jgi:hypothetical protein
MKITAGRLAQIAEKSPGYSVALVGDGEITNIRYRLRDNGRRNRSIVEMDNAKLGLMAFDSGVVLEIED